MDRLRQAPRSFALHLHALESARRSLDQATPNAEATIRRLARALAADSRVRGFNEINQLAERIPELPLEALGSALDQLLAAVLDTLEVAPGTEAVLLLVQQEGTTYDLASLLEEPGRCIVRRNSAHEAEEVLADGKVDLVVMDLDLPDLDGREFLVRYWERAHGIRIPLFVVSSDTETLTMLECLALGATAFFGLPLDGAVVAAKVARAFEKNQDRTESRYDPITGLGNRAAFAEAFEEMTASNEADGSSVTLGVLEMFERGQTGERALVGQDQIRAAGQRLGRLLDGDPAIARLGGNELGVLLPGAGPREVSEMLKTARQEIGQPLEEAQGNGAVHLSFKGGLVLATPNMTLREAMTEADRRLQAAKLGTNSDLVTESPERAASRRILLTEDDRLMAKLTIHRLEREGYQVFHFATGTEASQQAEEINPDLMVLDVNMPGLNGMALLEQFRAQPATADVPILMLTALSRDGDKVRAFHLGANDFLTKPFSAAELVARVSHLIRERDKRYR